jgi:hypothetical protein
MTDQQEKLQNLVNELHTACGLEVIPLYPKMLVRVLPKESKTKGGILLPGGKDQSKPVYEGIVLRTYKPFFQKVWVEDIAWRKENWPEATYYQKVECELKPGDHILFPHIEYGITPVWPLDDGVGDYRMVPENVVTCKLEYETETLKQWLGSVIQLSDPLSFEVVNAVLEKADVVRKDLQSLTVSGN